ncbi:putative aldo keto reductase protein [Neofusicoccum parvum UCRNP2]|uniref:Putative aldo keto reductase protein n=1 Tax=Botryosphaeria parva (strain UCR-NP2) TaxID=1287680 RepID=R1EY62_BOTPV|nr:putative aldo keto reductase protein [Neofusicoccum parvum UCRNP2]
MATPSPRPAAAAAAKRAHVNMMTDTIVANLPAPALRSVVRALLTLHPDVTPTLEAEAKHLLLRDAGPAAPPVVQARVRCMLGCGLVFESLPLLTALVERAAAEGEEDGLAVAVDGDVVQAATAVQKMLVTAAGAREMADGERALYSDPQYTQALKLLQADPRVSNLGLCNFDTEHMEIVLREGIDIKTNQFSLIDSRPIFKMAAVCEKYGVKLLTYGTLCGGFLAKKWLNKPEPELFSSDITPSQRKYFEAILSWGGWQLFQTLLQTLSTIAAKHGVSISNVATRWVLDFPCKG